MVPDSRGLEFRWAELRGDWFEVLGVADVVPLGPELGLLRGDGLLRGAGDVRGDWREPEVRGVVRGPWREGALDLGPELRAGLRLDELRDDERELVLAGLRDPLETGAEAEADSERWAGDRLAEVDREGCDRLEACGLDGCDRLDDGARLVELGRLALERLLLDRLALERLLLERLPLERFALERLLLERLALERLPLERLALERLALDRLELERLALDRLEDERDRDTLFFDDELLACRSTCGESVA